MEIAGSDWKSKADKLKPGQSLLLENLRFDFGEKRGGEAFGRLSELGEVYVNDAFATCDRKHAAMYAVPKLCSPYPKARLSPTPPGTASQRAPQPS